jgi:hypothetical protein
VRGIRSADFDHPSPAFARRSCGTPFSSGDTVSGLERTFLTQPNRVTASVPEKNRPTRRWQRTHPTPDRAQTPVSHSPFTDASVFSGITTNEPQQWFWHRGRVMQRSGSNIDGGCGSGGATPACGCRASTDCLTADALRMKRGGKGGFCADRSGVDRACIGLEVRHHPFHVAYRDQRDACAHCAHACPGLRNEHCAFQAKADVLREKDRVLLFATAELFFLDCGFHGENHGVFSDHTGSRRENHGRRFFDRGFRSEPGGFQNDVQCVFPGNHGFLIEHHEFRCEDHGLFSFARSIFFFATRLSSENHRFFSENRRVFFESHSLFPCDHRLFPGDHDVPADAPDTATRPPTPAGHERGRRRHRVQRSRPDGCARRGTLPSRQQFPIRNRIALASGLLSQRRGSPSGSSHATCPKPGFRSTVFR